MKKSSLVYFLAVTSIFFNAINIPPTFATTKAKVVKAHMAGRTPLAPSNTILNGKGAPKPSLGIDGDFYIDMKSMNIYGPKTKGRWPTAISLRGPQGQTGATGSSGNNGKSGTNIVASGPQGSTGASGSKGDVGAKGEAGAAGAKGEMGIPGPAGGAGIKGDTGATGPAGAPGNTGAIGPQGSPGANGAQGPAGNPGASGAQGPVGGIGPQGATGVQGGPGAVGSQGATGATGATGPSGAQGVQGNAGAPGPSNSFLGTISFSADIQGLPGTAQSSIPFGTFQAGKSYLVRTHIQTFNSAQLVSTYPLAFSISASGAAPSIQTAYTVTNGSFWVSGAARDEVSIIAEVTIDGSATVTSYQLIATVSCGMNSGSFPVTLVGNFSRTLVGQIS